jgi:MSHA biogenesis protein MshO
MRTLHKQDFGFTLVEMIIVIVITGIIGGIVAIFLKAPVQGYVDSARRAELTDIADTAMRRMARDVRTAVPNSVRVAACAGTCVEFLPTKDGGRYRAQLRPDGTGDVLNFGVPDGRFDIVGSPINFAANDYIVVGSTQSSGKPPYDQTVTGVLRAYTGAALAQQTVNFFNTALPVWAELPSQHFYVVDGAQQAVTYACVTADGSACAIDPPINGNGTCRLMRYWGYNFTGAQVNPPAGGTSAILADHVSACAIVYDLPSQRFGLLAVRLTLTSGGESVSLYNEIHVNNAP